MNADEAEGDICIKPNDTWIQSHLHANGGCQKCTTRCQRRRRTSHVQNASNLFLGGGSSLCTSSAQQPNKRITPEYARHRIKLGHVGDKVHLVWLDGACARDELGGDVEHGEEHDRQVVGHEGDDGKVAFEEDFPGAELEGRTRVGGEFAK